MMTTEPLFRWLERRLDPEAFAWLGEQCRQLAAGAPERTLHLAFGQALRRAGRESLEANEVECAEALALHPGWDLQVWTREETARAALLLSLPESEKTVRAVLSLFQTADLREHVALVRALFLMPNAEALLHIAREAIRSNMGDVFEAVSQRNPYPAEHFDDIAWNQMVAKCVFVDLPLRSVYGLDNRANAALARMLLDLARERDAAGRALSPEAWRCIAPFHASVAAESTVKGFLERGAASSGAARRQGAALALHAIPVAWAVNILNEQAPDLVPLLQAGTLTWENYDKV